MNIARIPMRFYLGTHCAIWLERTVCSLMVSHRRLMLFKRSLPRAICSWLLDSGGFSELAMFGEWRTPMRDYVIAVIRYSNEIGGLVGAAPQDWMCEPFMIKKTGLDIREHQRRTIISYLDLLSASPMMPWFPVLQGYSLDDYQRHVDDYTNAGIDLASLPRVGVGSVCRRQHTEEIAIIIRHLSRQGLKLHGFGVKLKGLALISKHLISADSMAWSFAARYEPPAKGHNHKNCANCQHYAEYWYRNKVQPLLWRRSNGHTEEVIRDAKSGDQGNLFEGRPQEEIVEVGNISTRASTESRGVPNDDLPNSQWTN